MKKKWGGMKTNDELPQQQQRTQGPNKTAPAPNKTPKANPEAEKSVSSGSTRETDQEK